MAASPTATCTGLLTSAGIERVQLGSQGSVMRSVSMQACVCVRMMRFVLACVWECESVSPAGVGVCACGFEVCVG